MIGQILEYKGLVFRKSGERLEYLWQVEADEALGRVPDVVLGRGVIESRELIDNMSELDIDEEYGTLEEYDAAMARVDATKEFLGKIQARQTRVILGEKYARIHGNKSALEAKIEAERIEAERKAEEERIRLEEAAKAKLAAEAKRKAEAEAAAKKNNEAVASNREGHWVLIDLSDQMLYVYDGTEVQYSYRCSTGTSATPTRTGTFTVHTKLSTQTMRGADYVVENVKWILYFSGGQGIHGVYWHNSFGTPMSHGCVGLPESQAKVVYDWGYVGMTVIVQQ